MPPAEQEHYLQQVPEIKKYWHSQYGDRINEIVLIGVNMNQETIKKELNQLTLTDEELNRNWNHFEDPLPKTNETIEMYEA